MVQGNGSIAGVPAARHPRLTFFNRPLERIAVLTTTWVGSSWAFMIATPAHRDLAGLRPLLRVLEHLAAGDEHHQQHRHLPEGVLN
jgi:hypothetical protein